MVLDFVGSNRHNSLMTKQTTSFKYIDLFAGCGGLSLGLESAGGKLIVAVERSPMAGETFFHNLITRVASKSEWEEYVSSSLENQVEAGLVVRELSELLTSKPLMRKIKASTPDLVVGGPPCQGFSLAGRRNKEDLRNQLPWQFLEVVEKTSPKMVVIENVVGMRHKFDSEDGDVFQQLQRALEQTGDGYVVQAVEVNALHYGAPQHRPRLMLIGLRKDLASKKKIEATVQLWRSDFLDRIDPAKIPPLAPRPTISSKGFRTVGEAIADLQSGAKKSHINTGFHDDLVNLFHHLSSSNQEIPNHVERAHTQKIQLRFSLYQAFKAYGIDPRILGVPSEKVTKSERAQLLVAVEPISFPLKSTRGELLAKDKDQLLNLMIDLRTKKHSQRVLDWGQPARTVVTVADDYVHPFSPRTFTVRELARFQGFPDTFEFRAKETTGGLNRRSDVPQYSQVGNAVSPFLALAVGNLAKNVLN